MVAELWGASVAEKFTNEEIFLVIEPIIANQFTQSGTNPMQSKIDSLPDNTSMETLVRILRQTENATSTIYPQTALSSDLQNLLTTAETNLANINKMPTTVSEPIRKNLLNNMKKANWKIYKTLGEAYASTPKGLISYFNSLTADSGYTKAESGKYYYRKYANCYAYVDQTSVICKNANFQLWNSSSPVNVLHTDSDINTKSIGMICMIAWGGDNQTTCDEPDIPSEHKAPDESTGSYVIVKNYRVKNANGTYTEKGCYIKTNVDGNITIEDEGDSDSSYKIKAWKVSSYTASASSTISSITWSVPGNISQSGSSSSTVTLTGNEKTLYVLLEKSNKTTTLTADYIVGQSQIVRNINLDTTDSGKNLLASQTFTWTAGSLEGGCDGHDGPTYYDACSKNCPGHSDTDYCESWSVTDGSLNLLIKNDNKGNYPTVTGLDLVQSAKSENRGGTGEQSFSEKFQYNLLVHRGQDSLTVASFKNSDSFITGLNNFNSGNSKSLTRKTSDYKETIDIKFVDDSSDLDTSGEGSEGCTSNDTASLNEVDITTSILFETYSGKDGRAVDNSIDSSDMMTVGSAIKNVTENSSGTVSSGKMINSGLSFSFHPYIKMRYDTLTETDKEVYILGEYKRSMTLNDYAEVKWSKTSSPNMVLDSLQWSTHAQAIADKGIEVSGTSVKMGGNVLPGGAELNLTIPKANRQTVKVTTYQCILDGAGRQQVEATSGSVDGYTKATALQAHKDYVETVKSGLSGLCIAQWQNNDDTANPFDGIKVYAGSDISSLKKTGTTTASTEDKYYFRENGSGSNKGNIDVYEDGTTTNYYVFSSDTSGNILMNGTVILTKGQDVSSLERGIAKEIETRTYVVTKLVAAVERNTGLDYGATWVSDGKWYNEAFDGITVAVSTTVLSTGFNEPFQRSAIQDPKLNVKSLGQSNMFSDYMVSAYKMNSYSINYGEKNVVGQFKGTNIKMNGMEWLYYTRSYYLTNVTVQDLH
jgi:hypothetical protein